MRTKRGIAAGLALLTVVLLGLPLGAADKPMFEGKPAFKEGRSFGYYVWCEGDTWHVRWLTFGTLRTFRGSVQAEGGQIRDLKRIDVETERTVIAPGRPARVVRGPRGRAHVVGGRGPVVASRDQDMARLEDHRIITFTARTNDDVDGFDFKASEGVTELRFDLRMSGAARGVNVEAGRENRAPDGNPFVVRLR